MNGCECAACQRKEPKPATGEDLAIYQEIADNFWRDKKIATLEADLATRTTQLSQVTLRMRELEQEKGELAAALDCAESLFERKWNSVVGSGCEFHWHLVGNWRHLTCKMTGETFVEAITKVKQ